MRKMEVEKLLLYFLNERDRLQAEVNGLRQTLRFRPVDQSDCLELALALERLHSFVEFQNTVCALLNLWGCEYEPKEGESNEV